MGHIKKEKRDKKQIDPNIHFRIKDESVRLKEIKSQVEESIKIVENCSSGILKLDFLARLVGRSFVTDFFEDSDQRLLEWLGFFEMHKVKFNKQNANEESEEEDEQEESEKPAEDKQNAKQEAEQDNEEEELDNEAFMERMLEEDFFENQFIRKKAQENKNQRNLSEEQLVLANF